MSKPVSLVVAIRAFLGNDEAATIIIGDAMAHAVTIFAQSGTRAPLDAARAMEDWVKGKGTRADALRAGFAAILPTIDALQPGRSTPADAKRIGSEVSGAFVVAVAEVLTAPRVKAAPKPAAEVAAAAAAKLAGLDGRAFAAFAATTAGRDLLTRLEAAAAARAAVEAAGAVKTAARVIRAARAAAPVVAEVATSAA